MLSARSSAIVSYCRNVREQHGQSARPTLQRLVRSSSYAQNTLSQRFSNIVVEQRFAVWHACNANMVCIITPAAPSSCLSVYDAVDGYQTCSHDCLQVDLVSSLVMVLMIFGMALVKPRPMIIHEPLCIALAMAPHLLRCSLITCFSGWCDITSCRSLHFTDSIRCMFSRFNTIVITHLPIIILLSLGYAGAAMRRYQKHRETLVSLCYLLTMVHVCHVTLGSFAGIASFERFSNVWNHVRMAGGESMLILPLVMQVHSLNCSSGCPPTSAVPCMLSADAQQHWLALQVRFHKYVVIHFLGSALCIASLPRLGAVLEDAVPQWTAAAFVQFGVALHTTLVLVVPLATNRLIMRSERRLFVHSDERLCRSVSGGYGDASISKRVARA